MSMEKERMERIMKLVDEDNEQFLHRIRDRTERVGIKSLKIEVRFANLSVEGEVVVKSREIPSLLAAPLNTFQSVLGFFRVLPSKRRKIPILKDINGIVKPSRMTLLLGPPGSGKTTFLQALAGNLSEDKRVSGKVTYCGHELNEFIPQRTCAFVGQHDLLFGQMTVRETLDFSARFQGVGLSYETMEELSRREKEKGIIPDPEIDAFMTSMAMLGQETSFVTDYVLKILRLNNCADTLVGDTMIRGNSGGEKKRVSIGEILVGPAKVLLMDEISTGLDSSTTFQICKYLSQMVRISDMTMVTSLLQPAPETYDLFDDIILLSEGQIVYQGPRENVLEFFEYTGFKCPERKGLADFLQEVTSRKDQEQYWFNKEEPYRFVSVPEFVEAFKSHKTGQQLEVDLKVPYDKSTGTSTASLAKEKYGVSNRELLKACFSREWLLMKRNAPVIMFRIALTICSSVIVLTAFFKTEMPVGNIQDGRKFLGPIYFSVMSAVFTGMVDIVMTILRLPMFYKQRDLLFYPPWAFALPMWVLRIPLSIIESGLWVILTYYPIGFAPDASRAFKQFLAFIGIYQMSFSLGFLIGAVGRTRIVANALGPMIMAILAILGGFIINKNEIEPWLSWSCYFSPLMYGQSALVMNEFLDERWSSPNPVPGVGEATVGKAILESLGVPTQEYWFWVCFGALFAFSFLFSALFVAALTYLNPIRDLKTFIPDGASEKGEKKSSFQEIVDATERSQKRGLVLPILPVSVVFNHVNYYIDIPAELKRHGSKGDKLQLLKDVSGAFRPGKLTAIVGASGSGKTTLMDVLSGRKTGGYIEGSISISGYPKNQETFSRVTGYCEQNDIHSPNVTVYESLIYSAWLRLPKDVGADTIQIFVEEIMELIELSPIREALVGLPGVNGLSTEQRKRLTIAVELVANPSIIFMDEATSGLDAKAAAIVMRTVRNTVDTGRTVVCTIHQPSIDIFEAFDELLLMKLGGQVIYAGPLGRDSHQLIEYFEGIPGIPKICDGFNPATWVLEVTAPKLEDRVNVNFAELYAKSLLYLANQELIKELSTPKPGSEDLYFGTKYSQPFSVQCQACFWKQHRSYWRNTQYITVRFFMAVLTGASLGLIFWNKGQRINRQRDLVNLLGAMYGMVILIGINYASTVMPLIFLERTVFYRERAARMYSSLAYALAQVGIEIIYTAVQSLMFTLLLFPLFGLEWTATKFFWFYYYLSMVLTYYTLFGMMMATLSPGLDVATSILYFFIRLWNLFSGFFILRTQIPIWWSWYYWASPVAWSVYGLVTSQVGDKDADLEVLGLGSSIRLKTFLKETFGFEYEFLHVVALVHVGWVLLFLFVFACGINYLNFQKR